MTVIQFDIGFKNAVLDAQREWLHTLQTDPAPDAADILNWVEHPQIGNTVAFKVDDEFIEFLREKDIPFEEE